MHALTGQNDHERKSEMQLTSMVLRFRRTRIMILEVVLNIVAKPAAMVD